MAVMDPTGGLRDISTLGRESASFFHEDFSEEEGRPADVPLVSQKKPRRRRTGLPTKQGVRKFNSKLDYHKLNYRARLTLRISSMIVSGTTLGSIGSVLFTYTSTHAKTYEHGGITEDVWPKDMFFDGTYVMLAAALITFVVDLAFFVASIKVNVRKLVTVCHKFSAFTITSVCLGMLIAAVAMDAKVAKGKRGSLFWVCVAREQKWDHVSINFPFLCGEMASPSVSLSSHQSMILMIDRSRRDGHWSALFSCRRCSWPRS